MGENKQGNTTLTNINIKTYLSAELTAQDYGFVKVFEAYPDTTDDDFYGELPGVSIGIFGDMEGTTPGLGNEQQSMSRPVKIDIFTKPRQDGQLSDLIDIIKDLFKKGKVLDFIDYNNATPSYVTGKLEIVRTRSTILGTAPTVYNHGMVVFDAVLVE